MCIIQIVGSAPGVDLVKSDHTYFANYSILAFKRKDILRTCGSVTVIGAQSAFRPEFFSYPLEKVKDLQSRRRDMQTYPIDKVIMYSSKRNNDDLNAHNFHGFYSLNYSEIKALYLSILIELPPFFIWSRFLHGARNNPKRFLNILINSIFFKDNLSAYTRPSSGVITLLYAISRHGTCAKYVLNGISLSERQEHLFSEQTGRQKKSFTQHVDADNYVIKKLIKLKYCILVLEAETQIKQKF